MEMPLPENLNRQPGMITKGLWAIAAVDGTIMRLAPSRDWYNGRMTGVLLLASFVVEGSLLTLIGENIFAPDQFRPEVALGADGVAAFITLLDSQMIIASAWHLMGISELYRVGLDISGGAKAHLKAAVMLVIRLAISTGLATLTGVFVSLLVFAPDISARIDQHFRTGNEHTIASATMLVDGALGRAAQAVKDQNAAVASLSSQVEAIRQNRIDPAHNDPEVVALQTEITSLQAQKTAADDEVEKLQAAAADEKGGIKGTNSSGRVGAGSRYRAAQEKVAAARAHGAEIARSIDAAQVRLDALRAQLASGGDAIKERSDEQLPEFERTLAAENSKLEELQNRLVTLTNSREDDIRRAVEQSPEYVKVERGFLAQITALDEIASENVKIKLLILVFELVAGALELGAVLGKTVSYCPTTYSALLAGDVFMRATRIADGMSRELDIGGERGGGTVEMFPPVAPANDDNGPFNGSRQGLNGPPEGPTPPKRPRGRPRKNPFN